jgi:hypothetical protein
MPCPANGAIMPSFQLICDSELDGAEFNCEPIVYKVAENRYEREAAFRLVYEAYTRAGLIEANPHEMRVTPYQLLDTTDVFVAMTDDEVISTVSLVDDGELGLPMEHIYGDEVMVLRNHGIRVAEVSCLADRRRQLSRTLPVFVPLMRLMVQAARHHGIEHLLVAVHPRHVRFYQRFLAFEPLGIEKSYPLVRNNPAVALRLDFAKIAVQRPVNYDAFFGTPLPPEQLQRRPISQPERDDYTPAADYGAGFMLVGASDEGHLRGAAVA